MNDFTRLFDIIHYQNEKYPKPDALVGKENGAWRKYSTQEVVELVNAVSLAFIKLGLKPGDTVALVSNNRPEWNILDMGMLQAGIINVPIYPTISEQEYKFIFNDAGIHYVFVGDKNLFAKISNIKNDVPTLKAIYTFDKVDGAQHFSEFLVLGKGGDISEVEKIKASIAADSLATIIYTSGTTGTPKGVMLSHHNIVSNIKSVWSILPVTHRQRILSFLPLCHIFERMVVYIYMARGTSVYYAESIDLLVPNLKELKPNFFTTVPRLLEKVYAKFSLNLTIFLCENIPDEKLSRRNIYYLLNSYKMSVSKMFGNASSQPTHHSRHDGSFDKQFALMRPVSRTDSKC